MPPFKASSASHTEPGGEEHKERACLLLLPVFCNLNRTFCTFHSLFKPDQTNFLREQRARLQTQVGSGGQADGHAGGLPGGVPSCPSFTLNISLTN